MTVVLLERGTIREVADQREIDGPAAGREISSHFDALEPGDAPELSLEGGADFLETAARLRLKAPQHDVSDHRLQIVAG